ncbi:MAG: hypothetical protein WCF44_10790 [Candidatus Methylophosphatis roskildensis]|uniref:Uncharacterized protein n=1 Tax=Candidatus Methylophosphatis roskildensis TaxID=2899263 RepID=A0A9D7E4M9_9PROT|nr:hypothetical protein [Candidatus Methylophosphatis roskildensis]
MIIPQMSIDINESQLRTIGQIGQSLRQCAHTTLDKARQSVSRAAGVQSTAGSI